MRSFFGRLNDLVTMIARGLAHVVTLGLQTLGNGIAWFSIGYPKLSGGLFIVVMLALCYQTYGIYTDWQRTLESEQPSEFTLIPSAHFGKSGCDSECQAVIRASRSLLTPIEANETRYVLMRLQQEYSAPLWQNRIITCLAHWDDFEWAHRYTLYPTAFIAGKAYVEGAGCKFAKSFDGGYGPLQVTHPTRRQIQDVANMLHVKESEVAWKTNYRHNLLLGLVMFSYAENEFSSRGPGILAYNTGAGGVRKHMRKAGLTIFTKREISNFRGTIPEQLKSGACPKIYVDRVLAGAVLMDRAHRKLPTVGIASLTLADIPGANPKTDSLP